MKHFIVEVNEKLTKEQFFLLSKWASDRNYWDIIDKKIISDGQMIEFLDEHTDNALEALAIDKGEYEWHVYWLAKNKPSKRSVELCDALWAVVIEFLEHEIQTKFKANSTEE